MRQSPSVLVYTASLGAASETFVTGLVECVSEIAPDRSIVTHEVLGTSVADGRVSVIPRHRRRGSPAWFVNVTLRTLARRELFELDLGRFLSRRAFHVVHAQFGQPGYWIYRALPDRQPAPRLVVNFYGYDATGLPGRVPIWRRHYAEMFRYPNLAVVVEGPAMKARLAGLGCPEDKIHVVPLCLALPEGGWPSASRAGREPPVLGMVGRFVEKKGFTFALRALAPLLKSRRHLRVVMVGDGPERPLIERLIAEHGLGDQVALAGMRPHAATLAEIGRMDALVVPSLTAHDGDSEGGAPTIVAEAQLIGTPVIASDHADIPVSLSDHSFMFKEGDPRALVEAVERFLDDRTSYDVDRARVRTRERHDRSRLRARYAAIYRGSSGG